MQYIIFTPFLDWFSCFIIYYHCSTTMRYQALLLTTKWIIKSCCVYCMMGLNTCTNKSHFCNTEEVFDSCLIIWICLILHAVAPVVDCFTLKKDTKQNYQELNFSPMTLTFTVSTNSTCPWNNFLLLIKILIILVRNE